jgi:Flp pilus assembly protein CpaB
MKRALLMLPLLLLSGAAPRAETPKQVAIVVAAVDIPAGTVVTFDMISQRSVDASLAVSAIVKPDSASYIVNQKVLAPMLAGDMMRWSLFETTKGGELCPATKGDAVAQVGEARARVLAR